MPESRRTAALRPERLRWLPAVIWYAGAALVLLTIVQGWLAKPFPRPLKPQLPYQYTPFSDPRYWVFLEQASDCVPPGSAFAVTAPSRDEEHELYLLAVGAIPQATPLAASYFGYQQNEHIARARYILSFGGAPPFGDVRQTCTPGFGVVYERIPAGAR